MSHSVNWVDVVVISIQWATPVPKMLAICHYKNNLNKHILRFWGDCCFFKLLFHFHTFFPAKSLLPLCQREQGLQEYVWKHLATSQKTQFLMYFMKRKKILSLRNRLSSITNDNFYFEHMLQNASQITSTTTCTYKTNASKL